MLQQQCYRHGAAEMSPVRSQLEILRAVRVGGRAEHVRWPVRERCGSGREGSLNGEGGTYRSTSAVTLAILRPKHDRNNALSSRLQLARLHRDLPDHPHPCKAQGGLLRMTSFSKEHDRNAFLRPFCCVKWGPQNLVTTAPVRTLRGPPVLLCA